MIFFLALIGAINSLAQVTSPSDSLAAKLVRIPLHKEFGKGTEASSAARNAV
jgi:hypothetical protein